MTMVILQAIVQPMVPKSNRITWLDKRITWWDNFQTELMMNIDFSSTKQILTLTTKSITFLDAL